MGFAHHPPRLLVIPGLHGSGPAHWQSWLQSLYRDAERVQQRDWNDPHLQRWAARWGAHQVNLGDAGHINAEAQAALLARERRFEHAELQEWSFAV